MTEVSALDTLKPGESAELPLPPVFLGRRAAYARIQRYAHAAFGPGGYRLRSAGGVLTVTRAGVLPKEATR